MRLSKVALYMFERFSSFPVYNFCKRKGANILDKLQTACGAMPDKKTVYTDLGVLEEYGMKVLRPHGRETEYRLIRGENELSYLEIKMLIDVVQSSRFLTKKQADTPFEIRNKAA